MSLRFPRSSSLKELSITSSNLIQRLDTGLDTKHIPCGLVSRNVPKGLWTFLQAERDPDRSKKRQMCSLLTRAWLSPQPNAIDWGGGGGRFPQIIFQTKHRSETGEAAFKRTRRDVPKIPLKFPVWGHGTGQGQVKGQNWAFLGLGLWWALCWRYPVQFWREY